MENLLQVGVITTTHGVRGEVKVYPTTDDRMRFKKLKQVLLDTGKEQRTLHITQVKFFKNLVILKFQECESMDEAALLRGCPLYVTRDQAVACGEDEYFIADLMGLAVLSEEGEDLGVLSDVLTTGANDVYVVSKPGSRDLLLPAIKDCILAIDLKARVMRVHLMAGLRD